MKQHKKAVVTGASKGIGFGICKKLIENGYEVWGVSRTKPKNDLGENFHWIDFDLVNIENFTQLISQLPGEIDLLVNDAGIWEITTLDKITPEHFSKTMDINFKAPVFLTIGLLNRINKGGFVINISSEMGIITEDGYGVYSASKAALDRFTTTLAKEQPQINVMGILPASVDTDGARRVYNYSDDPERISVDEIVGVFVKAIDGLYKSGSLVVVYNNECLPYWETRDEYTTVNVDD